MRGASMRRLLAAVCRWGGACRMRWITRLACAGSNMTPRPRPRAVGIGITVGTAGEGAGCGMKRWREGARLVAGRIGARSGGKRMWRMGWVVGNVGLASPMGGV
jgi:hypothetical protein